MNQEQTNITTGKQIRHLRTQLGMTQEELAGELNVTRQALSNWERDVNEPDLNMLKKICFLFGVNMDDFAKEVITKMETYEKKEKRQFNKYDIVNIALHISLKNFEQQCNGINIHFATLRGYLFHCGRRFALLIRVISTSLLCRRHSANGRTYPAVIPIAHVVAPDHCFQLFYRVIRTSSAAAVKQLVLHSCNQPTNTFAAGVVMTSASVTVHALPYSTLVQHGSV